MRVQKIKETMKVVLYLIRVLPGNTEMFLEMFVFRRDQTFSASPAGQPVSLDLKRRFMMMIIFISLHFVVRVEIILPACSLEMTFKAHWVNKNNKLFSV